MFWTAVWFVFNILFVVSVITYLFSHRAYTEAKRLSKQSELIRLDKRRKLIGYLSIGLFIAMSASFMINMRLNG